MSTPPENLSDLQNESYRYTPISGNPSATSIAVVNPDGSTISGGGGGGGDVYVLNALITVAYDTVQVTAVDGNDNPTTILYKVGGLSGTTVATLTIVYDGLGNFQSVVRS
jgi:hypothetical protein